MENTKAVYVAILFMIMGILGTYAVMNEQHYDNSTARIYTADWISEGQLSDSINKYAQEGYKVDIKRLDSTNINDAVIRDIRYLPYVEIVRER